MNDSFNQYKRFLEEAADLLALFEAIYWKQIRAGATSGIVQRTLNNRRTDPDASDKITPFEAIWATQADTLRIKFDCEPTYKANRNVSISRASAQQNVTGRYILEMQVGDVKRYLGDPLDWPNVTPTEQINKLKKLITSAPLQFHSDAPDFYYQGVWEDLSKLDGAIEKFPGPNGKDIWHDKHAKSGGLSNPNIHLTKHLSQLTQELLRLLPDIVKVIERWGPNIVPEY